MTPIRFAACLASLHWSQRGLAAILDAHPTQVGRWASGKASIPQPVADWLERLAACHAQHLPPAKPR